jgi:uncharacterized protein involved in exopolysaccharide biosynthesis
MLQTNQSQMQPQFEAPAAGLDPWQYVQILRKRWLLLVVPSSLVLLIGVTIVMLRPATYLSQGKILIESQQIPVELVRPTVTATAAARIQVIEQRVMTRDNLLAVVNKFQVFVGQKHWLWGSSWQSGTEILDQMKKRTQIKPIDLDLPRQRPGLNTIAFSVSFEHEQPDMARKVANELMTLILAEDARTRTSRAAETTQFLAREQKRLESELGSVESQIVDFKRKNRDTVPEQVLLQIATLRAELQQKASIYSESHPALKPLQQQIAALEKVTMQSAEAAATVDVLKRQRESIQRNLDDITQKLTIARRGETLERNQQSERLEVIEQPVLPTAPVKGNRLKLLVLVFGVAMASGLGGVVAAEALDRTIRGTADLGRLIDSHLIVGIPYIQTKAEASRNRRTIIVGAQAGVVALIVAVAGVHFLWKPLDELWAKVMLRMLG